MSPSQQFFFIDGFPKSLSLHLIFLPQNPLPAGDLRSDHLRGEGLPRGLVRVGDHQRLLRAGQLHGEVRPQAREVHGLLHALQGRRGPQGCQCCHRCHQDQEEHPVCGLVSNWFQGMYLYSLLVTRNLQLTASM